MISSSGCKTGCKRVYSRVSTLLQVECMSPQASSILLSYTANPAQHKAVQTQRRRPTHSACLRAVSLGHSGGSAPLYSSLARRSHLMPTRGSMLPQSKSPGGVASPGHPASVLPLDAPFLWQLARRCMHVSPPSVLPALPLSADLFLSCLQDPAVRIIRR